MAIFSFVAAAVAEQAICAANPTSSAAPNVPVFIISTSIFFTIPKPPEPTPQAQHRVARLLQISGTLSVHNSVS